MNKNDDLGVRMKFYYEQIPKTKLMRRTPVAIRLDGKAFHTFTKGFQKPFDDLLIKAMQLTMEYLCKNIQGCVFGYTQSDEITLILTDYKNLNTAAWFDYEVQKMCSVSASIATMFFNKIFKVIVNNWIDKKYDFLLDDECNLSTESIQHINKLMSIYNRAVEKGAVFDSRCFNIPKEEVANLIYWRQLDARRNSIEATAQHYFSVNELKYKSQKDMIEMLLTKNVDWEKFSTHLKWGTSCYKEDGKWVLDLDMPKLHADGVDYSNYVRRLL